MDIVTYALAKKYADKVAGTGMFCGYVEPGGSFPTARPDGSALKSEDYVKPKANATFPFTVGGITFETRLAKAFYAGGTWMLDAGAIPETHEVVVKSPADESLSKEALNQKAINIENKKAIEELQLLHGPDKSIEADPVLCNKGNPATITIKYSAKKTIKKIKAIALLRDATVLQNQTSGVEEGGTFTYTDTISADANYYVQVTDIDNKVFKSEAVEVTFLSPSYRGYASIGSFVELPISKENITEVKYTCDFDKPVFKWPKDRGELTSILAATDGNYYENYLPSFERTEDGAYYIYTLKDACHLDGYSFSFIIDN